MQFATCAHCPLAELALGPWKAMALEGGVQQPLASMGEALEVVNRELELAGGRHLPIDAGRDLLTSPNLPLRALGSGAHVTAATTPPPWAFERWQHDRRLQSTVVTVDLDGGPSRGDVCGEASAIPAACGVAQGSTGNAAQAPSRGSSGGPDMSATNGWARHSMVPSSEGRLVDRPVVMSTPMRGYPPPGVGNLSPPIQQQWPEPPTAPQPSWGGPPNARGALTRDPREGVLGSRARYEAAAREIRAILAHYRQEMREITLQMEFDISQICAAYFGR